MTQNPFQSTPCSDEATFQSANRPHVGLRLLRVIAGVTLPVLLLAAADFLVADIFFINRHDPEYLRLLDSYAAGYLFFDFLLYCVIIGLLLGLPLIVYSVVLEFFCSGTIARFSAGLGFGILATAIMFYYGLSSFASASRPEIAESCIYCLLPTVIMVGLSLCIGYFSSSSKRGITM